MKKILVMIAIIVLLIPTLKMTMSPAEGATTYASAFCDYAPSIDGTVSTNEWATTSFVQLSHGRLYLQHDAANLYLLLDLTDDTSNDPPLTSSPWGDFCSLYVDVNRDGVQTPQVDLLFALYPGTHTFGKQINVEPGSWTGLWPCATVLGAGFGASAQSATAHRIWEIAVSLPEVAAVPGDTVRFGLRMYSQTPYFDDRVPTSVSTEFTDLIEASLERREVGLLILSDATFMEALKPLKQHKDDTGIATYVQSWQTLNRSFLFEGRDEPERIKKAIVQYEKYCGTRWVMLVGDCNRFPVRYTMTDRGTQEAFNRAFYSADLYYACLYDSYSGTFDDWDVNQNLYFGELHGETIAGTVNIDQVDLTPDIMVGRVPAETAAEVTNYVNKVINYEFSAYKSSWFKKALVVATNNWVADACLTKENITASYLNSFEITKLYSANPYVTTPAPTSTNINNALNAGAGFANYLGHGASTEWSIPDDAYTTTDASSLTNAYMLPVMFAGACDTAQFTTQPPYSPYTDIYGTHHSGTNLGEIFSDVPPPPAGIQAVDNPNCFAEDLLVNSDNGAIGYVGCVTGAQPFCLDLDRLFFESYNTFGLTLGAMWNHMLQRYYQEHVPPATIDPVDWVKLAEFHQPWKFHLFGDPSLRIGGISTIQLPDFEGTYNLIHDGWNGTLELKAGIVDYIESLPNLVGNYTQTGGQPHRVRGYVRTWDYPIPPEWGPDQKIVFYIDFYDTPDEGDDQKFEGYLFTQTRNAIAGVTWWNSAPFGFYALKNSVAAHGVPLSSMLGTYSMDHDGWKGRLELKAGPGDYIEQTPNIVGTYTGGDNVPHAVRGYTRTPTYPLPPEWGPDYKIEFYIDFADSIDPNDDQKFEGYLFTQTTDALAGTTWWSNTPFGFYARRTSLPFVETDFDVLAEAMHYIVHTSSNSTVDNFSFSKSSRLINFNVTGLDGYRGLCNITIPLTLMWGTFSVWLDKMPLVQGEGYIMTANATHALLSIQYMHSTHMIEISAEYVVPELLPFPALLTLLLATLPILASLVRTDFQKRGRKAKTE